MSDFDFLGEGELTATPQAEALATAQRFISWGWAAVPMRPNEKRPAINWKELQDCRLTETEVLNYRGRSRAKAFGLGLVTGPISNLVVVDLDVKQGATASEALAAWKTWWAAQYDFAFPETYTVKTQGGGIHIYLRRTGEANTTRGLLFLTKAGIETETAAEAAVQVDIRGDGGVVATFPTVVRSGDAETGYSYGQYVVLSEVEPADTPGELLTFSYRRSTTPTGTRRQAARVSGSPLMLYKDSGVTYELAEEMMAYIPRPADGGERQAARRTVSYVLAQTFEEDEAASLLDLLMGLWGDEGKYGPAETLTMARRDARVEKDAMPTWLGVHKLAKAGGFKGRLPMGTSDRSLLDSLPVVSVTGPHYRDALLVEFRRLRTENPGAKFTIYLDGQMGSGKTGAINALLAGEFATKRALLLGHRVSLNEGFAQRTTEETGIRMASYRERKGTAGRMTVYSEPWLSVCVNSATNLPSTFDVVGADELEQQLQHLVGDTTRKSRDLISGAYVEQITSAELVVAADAHLSGLSVQAMRLLRPEAVELRLRIDSRPFDGRLARSFSDSASLRWRAVQSIREGRRVWYAAMTKPMVKELAELISQEAPAAKVLLVTSETSDRPEVLRFLANPNGEVENWDAVLASPTIGSGVSVTGPKVDDVFLECAVGANMGNVYDALQQAHRVRQPRGGELCYYTPEGFGGGEELAREVEKLRLDFARRTYETAGGERDSALATFQELLKVETAALKARSDANFRRLLDEGLASMGYRLVSGEEGVPTEAAEAMRAIKAGLRDDERARWVEAVLAAPSLGRDKVAKLQMKEGKTLEEKAAVERFWLQMTFHLAPEELTAEIVEAEGKDHRLRMAVLNLVYWLRPDLAQEADRRDAIGTSTGFGVSWVDFRGRQARLELAREFFVQAGIPEGPSHRGDIELPAAFLDWVLRRRAEVQVVLGEALDLKKGEELTANKAMRLVKRVVARFGAEVGARKSNGRKLQTVAANDLVSRLAERHIAKKDAEQAEVQRGAEELKLRLARGVEFDHLAA